MFLEEVQPESALVPVQGLLEQFEHILHRPPRVHFFGHFLFRGPEVRFYHVSLEVILSYFNRFVTKRTMYFGRVFVVRKLMSVAMFRAGK